MHTTLMEDLALMVIMEEKKNFIMTPSLACGYYKDGREIKAGNPLEFYIGIDMFYRFKNNARIGVGIFHISNADSGKEKSRIGNISLKISNSIRKLMRSYS